MHIKLNMEDINVTPFNYQFRENRFVERSTLLTGVNENLPRFSELSSHVDKFGKENLQAMPLTCGRFEKVGGSEDIFT